MGLLFTQKDDDLLYIIKRAAEKLEVGTWANLSAVYNDLATSSMTKERLKSRYMAMDKTAAESRTSDPAWDRAKIEAEERLRALCEAGILPLNEPSSEISSVRTFEIMDVAIDMAYEDADGADGSANAPSADVVMGSSNDTSVRESDATAIDALVKVAGEVVGNSATTPSASN